MSLFFKNSDTTLACIKTEAITLTDCLACSGCISNDEAEEFKTNPAFLKEVGLFNSLIISSHSILNIYQHYTNIPFVDFEKSLISFLKKRFNLKIILNTSFFRKEQKTGIISSECPAIVLYVERVFPTLIPMLSLSKTYQQIAAEYIYSCDPDAVIASIMQCYDKKNELKRDSTNIKYFLGTKEFYNFIKDEYKHTSSIGELEDWEHSYLYPDAEISGLEKSINTLKQLKDENIDTTTQIGQVLLELRACKGGCAGGPALLDGGGVDVFLDNTKSTYVSTSKRIFSKPKKKTFAVEW